MYLTVINTITGWDVPFERLTNGEIRIMSSYPLDTEDNCEVILTKTFYEYSVDFNQYYERN